ncbi:MAG TPA: redoxin domain-containing protein, partial [Candidatus Eisenbacteria bacterium]|nr:redoxin domain-containing protein [Candidatus Eisenbacteria bacterium]
GAIASTAAPTVSPEVRSDVWINAEPSAIERKGRVTIVEFWTFGCINCRRTVPAMKRLHADIEPKGVLVIGVHTPEFPHEAVAGAVRAAVKKHAIEFPVALDNEHAIWKAFKNRYWPTLYLIDRSGRIRATHVGELHVGTAEWDAFLRKVETLLAEPAADTPQAEP